MKRWVRGKLVRGGSKKGNHEIVDCESFARRAIRPTA